MLSSTVAVTQPGSVKEEWVQKELKRQLGEPNYQHWFNGKTRIRVAGEQLVVCVASPFVQTWMQRQFRQPLLQVARRLLGQAASVRFEVDTALAAQSARPSNASAAQPPSRSKPAGSLRPASQRAAFDTLTRRYATLNEFVVGSCNRLAATAVQQACELPGERLNPLFIHGSVGTGKTHLLEACYSLLRQKHPHLTVLLLTAEAFANYFTQALSERRLPAFRQRFRSVDVLLVDDVDFLDGKRSIQEEFLHTVQQLEARGCQLVVTCDRHPRLLNGVSEALVTRFQAGLICRLEAPDLETRKKILRFKAAKVDAEIKPDALDYIAARFRNNVRELEGALNCLSAYYLLLKRPLGVADARRILCDLERDCVRLVSLADVERAVCEMFRVQPDDLRSSKRQRSLSQPRMLAMFLARKHTQAAYREIGQYFGGRQHSTVLSAERRVRQWLSEGATIQVASQTWPMAELIEALEERLLAG